MTSQIFPAIPSPTTDAMALHSSTTALKESVEVLTRQRGDPNRSALSWQDLIASGLVPSGSTVGSPVPKSGGGGATVSVSGMFSTDDYGCAGDGSTIDDAAFSAAVNAVTAAGGGTLRIRGQIVLALDHDMPSNILLVGSNRYKDGLVRAPTAASDGSAMLTWNNKKNFGVSNMSFTGPTVWASYSIYSYGAIEVVGDYASTIEMNDWYIKGCFFQNWKCTAWIGLVQAAQYVAGDPAHSNVNSSRRWDITNNTFVSAAGDASTGGTNYPLGPGQYTAGSSFITIQGNTLTGQTDQATFDNGVIAHNHGLGYGCAGFVNCLRGNHNLIIDSNVMENMGDNTLPNDRSYVIMLYNSNPPSQSPHQCQVTNNVIFGYRNFGIYLAGCHTAICAYNNICNGTVTNTTEIGALPWGFAIACNGATDTLVIGNTIDQCPGGIYFIQDFNWPTSTDIVAFNKVKTTIGGSSLNPTGMYVTADSQALSTDRHVVLFMGNNINVSGASSTALKLYGGNTQFGRARFIGNSFRCSNNGCFTTGPSNFLALELTFQGNTYSGLLGGYSFQVTAGSTPLYVRDEMVDFSEVTAGSSNGVQLDGCTNLTIDGLILKNKTSVGAAISLTNAQGRVNRVISPGCTSGLAAAGSLGTVRPTYAAEVGAYVQNLNLSQIGTTPNAYFVRGYMNLGGGTTWVDDRSGNF